MQFLGRVLMLCVLFCLGMYAAKIICGRRLFSVLNLACIAAWGVAALVLTVFSRTSVLDVRYQLTLFEDFEWVDMYGFLENVLLFIPFGFLLCLCDRLRGGRALIAGSATSFGIELLQLATHRGICDIHDFMANTLGVCAAALLFACLEGLLARRD